MEVISATGEKPFETADWWMWLKDRFTIKRDKIYIWWNFLVFEWIIFWKIN
jgi:hypothetical protein